MVLSENKQIVRSLEPRKRTRAQFERALQRAKDEAWLEKIRVNGNDREVRIVEHALTQWNEHDNKAPRLALQQLKHIPVPIDEFIESPEFLGDIINVYPMLREDLRRSNPDVLAGEPPVHEVILGGAIGSGKTTCAIITTVYQLYLLASFEQPQRLFGLTQSTKLVFAVQSVTPDVTYTAVFEPLRDLIEEMPYARRHWSWNRRKKKVLEFDNGIKIIPVVASVRATAGQAVIGAIQDEANLMAVVERSKRAVGPIGQGGRYDQAEALYRHHSRRRKSRFTTRGYSVGTLCILGSANYQGDFIDRRMDEVRRLVEKNVLIVRHSQYEVLPKERFSGANFRLQVGNEQYPTKPLGNDPPDAEELRVEHVPVEYLHEFQKDPESALRDIVGIASGAIRPFISRRNKITEATAEGRVLRLRQWVDKPKADLASDGYPQWIEDSLPRDRDTPRFIHIDLSFSRDRCGIAIVKVPGMVQRPSPNNENHIETLPQFVVESAFTLQPSPMAELEFSEVRSLVMQLKTCYGFNIRQVSFDGFESRESILFLRKAGIRSEKISVDRSLEAYECLRCALYQNRVQMVESELLMLELGQLEFNAEKAKVDHPPKGSKDLADAVAGAIYAAATDRRVRFETRPVDREGKTTRARRPRSVPKREMTRRKPERKPGRRRNARHIDFLMEERRDRYRAEWEESQRALKKRYG